MEDLALVTTEELHLAYRVVSCLETVAASDEIASGVLRAAAELLRLAYRQRTLHDPLPGQVALL